MVGSRDAVCFRGRAGGRRSCSGSLYEFVFVTLVALITNKFWSEKLNKIVNLTIEPNLPSMKIFET